jgi:hypothetical protein
LKIYRELLGCVVFKILAFFSLHEKRYASLSRLATYFTLQTPSPRRALSSKTFPMAI